MIVEFECFDVEFK